MDRIRIGARKSDLARLQAYHVAEKIRKINPSVFIEFNFKESLGDKNLTDPLWKMPEKGVFTQDFVSDLLESRVDIVVHSWKDLPTDPRPGLKISATLEREDLRDVLLVKKDFHNPDQNKIIYSSSPRREKNIGEYLNYLGFQSKFVFQPVRGNIATRIRKFSEDSNAWALVVALAALKRLSHPYKWSDSNSNIAQEDFSEKSLVINEFIKSFDWLVCPLTHNPTAAAQGALAIESRDNDSELNDLLNIINDRECMAQVESERKQFKAYGGGCHQKIGISKFSVAGKHEMTIVRGETPNGELLNSVVCLTPKAELLKKLATDDPGAVWNSYRELKSLTQRVARNPQVIKDLKRRYESSSPDGLVWWVSKSAAMPEYFIDSIRPQDRVWASGIKTQKELMQKGVWVCGNSESLGVHSLGVSYPMSWDNKKPQNVVYLTHGEAPDVDLFGEKVTTLATYDLDFSALKSINQEKLFSNKVFLWGAASHFKAMLQHFPQLFKDKKMERYHFCGLGRSYDEIKALAVNDDIEIAPVLMNDFI